MAASHRRLIVLGANGFFGRAARQRLRADGAQPLAAARRPGADLLLDVEDPASLRAALRPGDVLIDTAGPFQARTTALLDAALEAGCHLVDIADSRAYVARIYARQADIAASNSVVLTACSSLSAVSAALLRHSAIADPVRLSGFLAPASRYASSPAGAASLLRSVGQPILVWDAGRLQPAAGWRRSRSLRVPAPIGRVRGRLFESADCITLPPIWPGLRTVDFYVDSRVPGLNLALDLAARSRLAHRLLVRLIRPGVRLARALGSPAGCLAFEIEGQGGQRAAYALVARQHGYFTPIVPAVIAARALAEGRFDQRGLVPPDRHVPAEELLAYLDRIGVRLHRW
jgi:hypothetical protein